MCVCVCVCVTGGKVCVYARVCDRRQGLFIVCDRDRREWRKLTIYLIYLRLVLRSHL